MKLVGALVALVCLSGCGGMVVLQSGTHAPPPRSVPAPVPCQDCRSIDRDEAVQIVRIEARRLQIERLRVQDVERKQHNWRVEGRGVDPCGHRVEVRARVDRRTGEIESFQASSKEHRKHRERHDDGDDD